MQIAEKHIRTLSLCIIVGAGLLLSPFPGQHVALAASPKIQTMARTELDRLMENNQGMHLLFFTAAWCGHCKTMLPTLDRLYRRFHKNGVGFMAISIDAGGPSAMQRVLEDQPVTFPVFWVGETVVDELKLFGIPMIFLIKKGRLVEKIPGTCSYAFLETKIQDLIK
jgi:thiol-disulfide isomerase/thioredoxin